MTSYIPPHSAEAILVDPPADRVQLSIMIPVYNEIRTIDSLLQKIVHLPLDSFEILIVDDGSTDGTREYLDRWMDKYAMSNPQVRVSLLLHTVNRGKGGAIQTGIDHAQGEYFIIQDADLEYEPNEILILMQYAIIRNAPVIYGSRFMGSIESMRLSNFLANRFLNFLLFLLYGARLTDMETCYKLIRTSLLRDLEISSEKFDFETEVTCKLLRRHVPIREIPITYVGRTHDQGKKIGWRDGWDAIVKLFVYRFSSTNGERATASINSAIH